MPIYFIVFATIVPIIIFPVAACCATCNAMKEIGALDVRNQCSGFVYAECGDQFIKTGMYKNILVWQAEKHSFGWIQHKRQKYICNFLEMGPGALVLQPTEDAGRGILSTHCIAMANKLRYWQCSIRTHANHWLGGQSWLIFDEAEIGEMSLSHAMIDNAQKFPTWMDRHIVK